ncbi:hypothetical protein GCM10027341_02650 [Spirosoma knui]
MFRLQVYRFGIARVLLGLYIAILINGIVFRHAHRLADGTIICHAHPYKSSPGSQYPSHAHSRDEFIWLAAFSNGVYTQSDLSVWTALVAILTLLTLVGAASVSISFSAVHVAYRHRGPPEHLV